MVQPVTDISNLLFYFVSFSINAYHSKTQQLYHYGISCNLSSEFSLMMTPINVINSCQSDHIYCIPVKIKWHMPYKWTFHWLFVLLMEYIMEWMKASYFSLHTYICKHFKSLHQMKASVSFGTTGLDCSLHVIYNIYKVKIKPMGILIALHEPLYRADTPACDQHLKTFSFQSSIWLKWLRDMPIWSCAEWSFYDKCFCLRFCGREHERHKPIILLDHTWYCHSRTTVHHSVHIAPCPINEM